MYVYSKTKRNYSFWQKKEETDRLKAKEKYVLKFLEKQNKDDSKMTHVHVIENKRRFALLR
jgi:hypothetical protein